MNNYVFNNDFIPEKIIVGLNKNINYPLESYISNILDGVEIEKIECIYHCNKESKIGDIVLICLKCNKKMELLDIVYKLQNNPAIAYAETNVVYDMCIIPNDPEFKYLWGMKRINVIPAWNYSTGNYNTVVGVLDSGIDYNHPDIKNNMWISLDGKYKNGWNFIENNNNPMDEISHGTHVAGTIGAIGNNCIGVAGTCWNVQLAAFKIGENRIDLDAAIRAIYFANVNNIKILNNSWGGSTYSPILKYVIEQYDGLFVAAAGNNGNNNDLFPIFPASYDCDNIISVAALNENNELARFSNYGNRTVDIAAPGTNILSTTLNNEYSYKNGTSMASPHVAGAAALLKSCNPCLTTSQIKNIILTTAEKNVNLDGKLVTGGVLNVNNMMKILYKFC